MSLTLSEHKFIKKLEWRDFWNLAIIFYVVWMIVLHYERVNSTREHWQYIFFTVMIFAVLFLLKTMFIGTIEKFIFKSKGKWYCPQCDMRHERRDMNPVFCNRPKAQNITGEASKNISCKISEQKICIPEDCRVFKYNLVLWYFWKIPFQSSTFKPKKPFNE